MIAKRAAGVNLVTPPLSQSLSKSPYLYRLRYVFTPLPQLPSLGSALLRGGSFLVCGCKDRAKTKYKPNLNAKYFPNHPQELHSFPHKQESYRGQKIFILLGKMGDFAGEERGD